MDTPGKTSLQRIVNLVRLFGCWILGCLTCKNKKNPTHLPQPLPPPQPKQKTKQQQQQNPKTHNKKNPSKKPNQPKKPQQKPNSNQTNCQNKQAKNKTKNRLTNYKQYRYVYVMNYFLCFRKWFCQDWLFSVLWNSVYF